MHINCLNKSDIFTSMNSSSLICRISGQKCLSRYRPIVVCCRLPRDGEINAYHWTNYMCSSLRSCSNSIYNIDLARYCNGNGANHCHDDCKSVIHRDFIIIVQCARTEKSVPCHLRSYYTFHVAKSGGENHSWKTTIN